MLHPASLLVAALLVQAQLALLVPRAPGQLALHLQVQALQVLKHLPVLMVLNPLQLYYYHWRMYRPYLRQTHHKSAYLYRQYYYESGLPQIAPFLVRHN